MALINPDDWRPVGVEDLEPNAWEALRSDENTCVVAGPGARKTEFLAQRAAYLLQTGLCPSPKRILAISFKKDAAKNLELRVRARCSEEQARRFTSVTFDAFAKGLVDRFFPAIPRVWRPTDPYEVTFPKRQDYEEFLGSTRLNAPHNFQSEITAIRVPSFEPQEVGARRLRINPGEPKSGAEYAVARWWQLNLRARGQSKLTFVMLNRLAELLLRANPPILRALRMTYPFVFLDEFQDTTYAQYDLLMTAFQGAPATLTAVGDDKQRIMVWAGARDDAFKRFAADLDAERISLLLNFRSSPELVRLQQVVARALDKNAAEVESRVEGKVDDEVAQIWTFTEEAEEAALIAEWLSSDMETRGLSPRDYAILARQTADRFEERMSGPLGKVGLRVRNESKVIGRTTLQDLLAEDLSKIAIAVVRLGVEDRAPKAWETARDAILTLRSVDPHDDVESKRAESELVNFISEIRSFLGEKHPSKEDGESIADAVFDFLGMDAVARSFPHYGSGDNLEIAQEAFRLHLIESAKRVETWNECLGEFEGLDQIPLMTVHKSKGLEFDTVLVVGLDDKMWWSFSPANPEGTATFFVGLSRAKQRVIFTYCSERGGRRGVKTLYELLASAGVPEFEY